MYGPRNVAWGGSGFVGSITGLFEDLHCTYHIILFFISADAIPLSTNILVIHQNSNLLTPCKRETPSLPRQKLIDQLQQWHSLCGTSRSRTQTETVTYQKGQTKNARNIFIQILIKTAARKSLSSCTNDKACF